MPARNYRRAFPTSEKFEKFTRITANLINNLLHGLLSMANKRTSNIIFIHGVNSQSTGYSNELYKSIIESYIEQLEESGVDKAESKIKAEMLVQKEILWADVTIDLTNRYGFLQYDLNKKPGKWNFLLRNVDPLVMQILYYVRDKGRKRGPMTILKRVHESFKSACSNKPESVFIIAHSLGSVVAYDYVCGFRKYRMNPKTNVMSFITLGSPIPLFTSAMGYVENRFKWPNNVKSWVNILDPDDGIARFCNPFFKNFKVRDVRVNTGFGPLGAHAGYWKSRETARVIAEKIIQCTT